MYASILSKRTQSSNTEGMEIIDGEICARILKLTSILNQILTNDSGASNSSSLQRLELSILYFMKKCKGIYLNESTQQTFPKVFETLKKLIQVGDYLSVLNVFVNKM
jgi:hypothetical protein